MRICFPTSSFLTERRDLRLEVFSRESSESTTSEPGFGTRFNYEAAAAYKR